MLQTSRILVRALNHGACAGIVLIVLLGLTACGQTGTLYLPTEPAAANRASLPESLWPAMPRKKEGTAQDAPTPAAPPAPTSDHTKP
ncbi:MAG: lipoprotein [Curvibacter sp.]